MHRGPIHREAKHRQHGGKTVHKEIEVLEDSQYAQIQDDVGGAHSPLDRPRALITLNEQATQEAACRRDDDENQETPVPPAVKDITRHKDEQVLPTQPLEDKPVEQEHYRQEYHECERVKKHLNIEISC